MCRMTTTKTSNAATPMPTDAATSGCGAVDDLGEPLRPRAHEHHRHGVEGRLDEAGKQEDGQAHRREREAVVLDARRDVREPY